MREIRFRAWTGRELEYKVLAGSVGSFFAYIDPRDDAGAINTKYGEQIPVMQFTGLHDKNGKEIYEGDVVKTMMHYADDYGNPVDGRETTFAVKWVESKGQQYVGLSLFPCDDIYHLEIIGNIYENPELLK